MSNYDLFRVGPGGRNRIEFALEEVMDVKVEVAGSSCTLSVRIRQHVGGDGASKISEPLVVGVLHHTEDGFLLILKQDTPVHGVKIDF